LQPCSINVYINNYLSLAGELPTYFYPVVRQEDGRRFSDLPVGITETQNIEKNLALCM
jgi:hypothetical protein